MTDEQNPDIPPYIRAELAVSRDSLKRAEAERDRYRAQYEQQVYALPGQAKMMGELSAENDKLRTQRDSFDRQAVECARFAGECARSALRRSRQLKLLSEAAAAYVDAVNRMMEHDATSCDQELAIGVSAAESDLLAVLSPNEDGL